MQKHFRNIFTKTFLKTFVKDIFNSIFFKPFIGYLYFVHVKIFLKMSAHQYFLNVCQNIYAESFFPKQFEEYYDLCTQKNVLKIILAQCFFYI